MKYICTLALAFAVSSPCWADVSSHWAKAEEYVQLSGSNEIIADLLTKLELGIEQETDHLYRTLTEQHFMPPEIDKDLQVYELEAKKVLRKIFNLKRINEEMIPMYMSYFSEEELEQLINFYRSPIGKSLTKKLPKIMVHSEGLAQERNLEYIEAMAPVNQKLQETLGLLQ